nr:MAG TPA: hypothetical protein [Caudoviricetes sp.]
MRYDPFTEVILFTICALILLLGHAIIMKFQYLRTAFAVIFFQTAICFYLIFNYFKKG